MVDKYSELYDKIFAGNSQIGKLNPNHKLMKIKFIIKFIMSFLL